MNGHIFGYLYGKAATWAKGKLLHPSLGFSTIFLWELIIYHFSVKEDTIIGHFLICYLAVLLTRLLQFKILKNNYCSEDLFEFVHDFRVAKISDRKYINLSRGTTFIKEFAVLCNLPLTSYFLSEGEIKKMLSHRF